MKCAHLCMIIFKAVLVSVTFLGTSSFHVDKKIRRAGNSGQQAQSVANGVAKDSQFLVRAAEINMEEVLLGQLAQQKSRAKEVIELGQTMEEAHTEAMGTLTELAREKKVTIPTMPKRSVREIYKKLRAKSESEFNKIYCGRTVDGHIDAIARFEEASKSAVDEDIKEWAKAVLPVLRSHLDRSRACQKIFETIN